MALGIAPWRGHDGGVSSKTGKVRERVAALDARGWDPRYAGWFECFNGGQYYEAHDVLEDLWLEEGQGGANHGFYKGLIQVAGAFVHLGKGRRGPAGALLRLARTYLGRYPARHEGLDVAGLIARCEAWERGVAGGVDVGRPAVSLSGREAGG